MDLTLEPYKQLLSTHGILSGRNRLQFNSSAIMESIDNSLLGQSHVGQCSDNKKPIESLPSDVTLTKEFKSLVLSPTVADSNKVSFLLLDGKECLKLSSADGFIKYLGCDDAARVKVISVFGNTGDGKSHTLNHTFFNGAEVFQTSSEQDSCTMGVRAAYDPHLNVICLDTEGLLGSTSHENQRTRLLLKVLAVSDIVIYRTRSERLHRDMFTFLGSASRAYTQHFQAALQIVGQRGEFGGSLSVLGPAAIIFHETRHTQTLRSSGTESPEDFLRARFSQSALEVEAFSSLRYIGVQTLVPPTNFSDLKLAIKLELENTTVRSPRKPHVVYHTLKVLNDKFSGEIEDTSLLFPDQYFTCPAKCLSCEMRCGHSMGHLHEGLPHSSIARCRYQHQYENCTYICKVCHSNGKEVIVEPKFTTSNDDTWFGFAKYAWSGYVIECPNCGIIYRSRQYWYGNKDPEDAAVRTEIQHVWPGSASALAATQNTAQKVLDGVAYLSEAVASVGSPPTRVLSSWMADQIAPKYWRANHEIKHCFNCKQLFAASACKHHCRSCGEGFCEACSRHTMPVPERSWPDPVRVCDACYQGESSKEIPEVLEDVDGTEVRVRKYGEAVVNTFSSVASVLEYPRGFIKDSVRPSYWVPDHEVSHCCCCQVLFSARMALHHCRDCGQGVCQACSTGRRPIPYRGWQNPVRVCDGCLKKD